MNGIRGAGKRHRFRRERATDDIEGNRRADVLNGGDGEDRTSSRKLDLSVPAGAIARTAPTDRRRGGHDVIGGRQNARIKRRVNYARTSSSDTRRPGKKKRSARAWAQETTRSSRPPRRLIDLDDWRGTTPPLEGTGDAIRCGRHGTCSLGNDGKDQFDRAPSATGWTAGGRRRVWGRQGAIRGRVLDGPHRAHDRPTRHKLVALVDAQGY